MRPALILNDFNGGGAERLVRDLATELDRRDGVDPVVITSAQQGELQATFEASPFDLSVLEVPISIRSVPWAVQTLVGRLRDLEVDVAHTHLAFSDLIGRLACAHLSLPHVSTYHNVQDKRPPVKRAVERATRRLSDRIICVSEGVRQSYGNHPLMCVIYNAIGVAAFNRRVNELDPLDMPADVRAADTVLLNVGRCVSVKRQWDLVHAVAEFDSDDVHLVIVGDGPFRTDIEQLILEGGLSAQVTVTGFVDSVEPYYAIADAFVSASEKEGLPTTHLEAMAAELPVISTDIPGVREIVIRGETGYLAPVGKPERLAALFRMVVENDNEKMGARGLEVAESRFAVEQVAADHENLYREVTGTC